jgi:hypothetical protein
MMLVLFLSTVGCSGSSDPNSKLKPFDKSVPLPAASSKKGNDKGTGTFSPGDFK